MSGCDVDHACTVQNSASTVPGNDKNSEKITILQKYDDCCVLKLTRGVGPRMIQEVWLPKQKEAVLFLAAPSSINDDALAVSAVQVNAHYKAYARGLVLVARDKSVAKRTRNLTVTIQCLCEGWFEPSSETVLRHAMWNRKQTKQLPQCQILVKGMKVAKSNTVGTISLVSICNVPAAEAATTVLPSRLYRKQMKANGTPILGNAEDARSFRGEALCMSVVQLEFDIVGSGKDGADDLQVQQHEVVAIPPLPRLQFILEKEQRFAHGDITHDGTATACGSSSSNTNSQHFVAGMPAAYVSQQTQFDGLTFYVTPAVMIPRPGSEAVVQRAVEMFQRQQSSANDANTKILDLGTGSGCLLLSILQRLPRAVGVGLDLSKDALAVAQQNASRLDMMSRCRFLRGEFGNLGNVLADNENNKSGAFDIIVCNPPYHTKKGGGRKQLDAVTLQHEPHMALFVEEGNTTPATSGGDTDLLRHYRSVLDRLQHVSLTKKGTVLVFEVFKDNAQHVATLMKDTYELDEVAIERDTKGCIRTVGGIYM